VKITNSEIKNVLLVEDDPRDAELTVRDGQTPPVEGVLLGKEEIHK